MSGKPNPPGKDMDLGIVEHRDLRGNPPDLMRPTMKSTVSFAGSNPYASDLLAYQIVSGRLNSDAFPDLLVGGGSQMTAYVNRGDGTFDVKPVVGESQASWQLSIDDLNGDGLGDLAWVDEAGMRVGVALGKGDGTFNLPGYYLAGKQAAALVAADMNGDARKDLVVATFSDDTLHVLLNNGNGGFSDRGSVPVDSAGGSNAIWAAQADVNLDGRTDIVISNNTSGNVNLFLGNGDGTLQMARRIDQRTNVKGLDLADLNFDGFPDLAVIGFNNNKLGIYLGHGDGTFTAGTSLIVSATTGQGVRIADVNGDAVPDIIAACSSTSGAHVFLGHGDGTFVSEKLIATSANDPYSVAIGDWNGDGLNDLALSEGTSKKISVIINTSPH